jgi:hypothetical protein
MKSLITVRWVAMGLLFFLGVSGVIGAFPMIVDPHGTPWQMPQSLLIHSPFHSYLVPGILLFCANGFLPLFICAMVLNRSRNYAPLIAIQGVVLFGWIVIECLMIRTVVWPHYLYGSVGLAMIACGALLGCIVPRSAPSDVLVTR